MNRTEESDSGDVGDVVRNISDTNVHVKKRKMARYKQSSIRRSRAGGGAVVRGNRSGSLVEAATRGLPRPTVRRKKRRLRPGTKNEFNEQITY